MNNKFDKVESCIPEYSRAVSGEPGLIARYLATGVAVCQAYLVDELRLEQLETSLVLEDRPSDGVSEALALDELPDQWWSFKDELSGIQSRFLLLSLVLARSRGPIESLGTLRRVTRKELQTIEGIRPLQINVLRAFGYCAQERVTLSDSEFWYQLRVDPH